MKTHAIKRQVKSSKNSGLTVDTMKCSKKDTIVIHKNAPKPAVKLSGKRFEEAFKRFQRDGLSPEERLLNIIFPDEKRTGLPKELRTREVFEDDYAFTESAKRKRDDIERKFNNGRKIVVISEREAKRIDTLRNKGFSVKAIAKELHRSDHTVREYLRGYLKMSCNAMEKAVKSGKRPAKLGCVTSPKKQ